MSSNTLKIKKRGAWYGTTRGDKVFLTIVYITIALIVLMCAYPLYLTVIASISDPYDVYSGKVNLLPSGFSLESYQLVFTNKAIWRGYGNSILYTVAGTVFNLFLTIPSAYALSKRRMYGRNFLTTVFLITMYFGGGMIPTYILYKNLGLIDTRWVLIIGGGVSVYNVIVTRTFFQNNIPETLFEAARIDGANEFLVFLKLVLPLSAPIIAVITLYYAVGHWGSYLLILNETAYTDALASGDASLIEDAARQAYLALTMKYSLVFIASAPMLVAYPFVQKHFVKGVMVGSLKG